MITISIKTFTNILEFAGYAESFEANYAEYEAEQAHRFKYKKPDC